MSKQATYTAVQTGLLFLFGMALGFLLAFVIDFLI